jgi:hypothetical protein
LLAALPSAHRVLKIDAKGKTETLLDADAGLPAPIAVATDPKTDDVLVADNFADVLVLLPKGEAAKRRNILKILGHEQHLQDMSIAIARDGHVVFGSSGPVGVFRFHPDENPALDTSLLGQNAGVAADPTSKRWVAALRDKLVVFEEARQEDSLSYPDRKTKWHSALAYGADGSLVMALHLGGTDYDIVQVDLSKKTFRSLFVWKGERVVSLTVAKKMAWGNSGE